MRTYNNVKNLLLRAFQLTVLVLLTSGVITHAVGLSYPASQIKSLFAFDDSQFINLVNQSQIHLKRTHYKLGGSQFDLRQGVYNVDCSGYVDELLKRAAPDAFNELTNFSNTARPNTLHYYNYFQKLAYKDQSTHWEPIDQVKSLKPGDILVFRYKRLRRRVAGHIMVVLNNARPFQGNPNQYIIRVADSSPYRHSNDTRRSSGVGQGDMLIKTDHLTGAPVAYAWKVDGPWQNQMLYNMARPV